MTLTTTQFLDILFEEPSTVNGMQNKMKWLKSAHYSLPFNSKYFNLVSIIQRETLDNIKRTLNIRTFNE